jgi:GT2 family glycosyltransferase
MQATLIIVNYNGRELLARSLPAALAAARQAGDHHVIVADDGSSDDSAEFVIYQHPEAKLLALRHRGFGATCNTAVAAAETEVVVLLNSDVVLQPNSLPPLLADLAQSDVFAAGCKFVNPDGSLTDALGNRTSGEWRKGLLYLHHETNPDRLTQTCPQLYANGGGMAFWREKWLALGGFDPLYHPFYWEDVDLGYRAWGRGWKVLYEPASVAFHEQGSTIARVHHLSEVELISARNAVLFTWKNLLDPRLFRRMMAAQARWAADDILIGGLPPRTRALWAALGRLRAAARRRSREQRERGVSDHHILSRAGGATQ